MLDQRTLNRTWTDHLIVPALRIFYLLFLIYGPFIIWKKGSLSWMCSPSYSHFDHFTQEMTEIRLSYTSLQQSITRQKQEKQLICAAVLSFSGSVSCSRDRSVCMCITHSSSVICALVFSTEDSDAPGTRKWARETFRNTTQVRRTKCIVVMVCGGKIELSNH